MATLSAGIAPLSADDMSMSCEPTSVSVPRGDSTQVECTVSALQGLGATSLFLQSVRIPAPPSGWTVSTTPVGTLGTDGALTIPVNATLAAGQTWSVTLTLSPACTVSGSGNWMITSRVANTNGTVPDSYVAGPAASLSATATDRPGGANASVVRSSLSWDTTFSLLNQTHAGSLTYEVSGFGCDGWSVSVVADPFRYTGVAPATSLSPENVVVTNVGEPVVVSGTGIQVEAVHPDGGLDASRTVMRAEPGNGIGTYQQELEVSMTIPGGAPVGTYESTITITTSAAP